MSKSGLVPSSVAEKRVQPARSVTPSSAEKRDKGGCKSGCGIKYVEGCIPGGLPDLVYEDLPPDAFGEDFLPYGAPMEHRRDLFPYFSRYLKQKSASRCYDIYDFPGASFLAGIQPIMFFRTPKNHMHLDLLTKLATRAIDEYNGKDCNVFKYKFLSIEQVNHDLTQYHIFYMTVKVLNLTLVTPYETFQICAAVGAVLAWQKTPGVNHEIINECFPKTKVVDGCAKLDGEGSYL